MNNVPIIAFFNNKGGVGKTSLVYHLAWMYADLGYNTLAADLDPQANLTAAFLDDDRLEQIWPDGEHPKTIYGSIQPLLKGIGDIAKPSIEEIDGNLALLPGDLALAGFEDDLSNQWPDCLDRKERAFRVMSAFWRAIQQAAAQKQSQLVLMDLGPNLGPINRAALIAANYVVVPLAPDLFSLQGLRNLGPTLRRWRAEWQERLPRNPASDLPLPGGEMSPIGYIVMQHSVRLDRPIRAYDRWIERIPYEYRQSVLNQPTQNTPVMAEDPYCLILLKHYRSLMPMAQEAHKPMFHLKPADGAIGSHIQAVQLAYQDFKSLAYKIRVAANL
ncbi:MAG: AAA family ATPase [Anaerolineales bacterium]